MKYREKIYERFWHIFKNDYLLTLREFKWKPSSNIPNIKEGDIVHVYNEKPRMYWRMGKVKNVYPGQDGIIRAAQVQLPPKGDNSTSLVRPIQHLYPIEVNCNDESSAATDGKI